MLDVAGLSPDDIAGKILELAARHATHREACDCRSVLGDAVLAAIRESLRAMIGTRHDEDGWCCLTIADLIVLREGDPDRNAHTHYPNVPAVWTAESIRLLAKLGTS